MKIRIATADDIPQIQPLWRILMEMHAEMEPMFKPVADAEEKFAVFLASVLTNDNFFVTVAEIDSKIVGYVIVSVSNTPEVFVLRRRMYVQDMVINPEYRRRGIGKELFDAVMKLAKEQKIEKLDLLVAVKNEESNKFWKAMGFEPALNYMNKYLV